MHHLATGLLMWNRYERVMNRYGFVYLMKDMKGGVVRMRGHELEGTVGELWATVQELRMTPLYEILPRQRRAVLGNKYLLGRGTLVFDRNEVGLEPIDGREEVWLNESILFKLKEQTVQLTFVPDP